MNGLFLAWCIALFPACLIILGLCRMAADDPQSAAPTAPSGERGDRPGGISLPLGLPVGSTFAQFNKHLSENFNDVTPDRQVVVPFRQGNLSSVHVGKHGSEPFDVEKNVFASRGKNE